MNIIMGFKKIKPFLLFLMAFFILVTLFCVVFFFLISSLAGESFCMQSSSLLSSPDLDTVVDLKKNLKLKVMENVSLKRELLELENFKNMYEDALKKISKINQTIESLELKMQRYMSAPDMNALAELIIQREAEIVQLRQNFGGGDGAMYDDKYFNDLTQKKLDEVESVKNEKNSILDEGTKSHRKKFMIGLAIGLAPLAIYGLRLGFRMLSS